MKCWYCDIEMHGETNKHMIKCVHDMVKNK
jgi:hypothetical protein